jgi:membrane protein implicated in regulation of membrane protease activity
MIGYIILMAVGFVFLLISFISSGLSDAFGGLFGGDQDIGGGDADTDVNAGEGVEAGPSFFNLRAIAAFVTGFGAMGWLLTSLGWNAYLAALPSLGVGFLMALITYGVTMALFRQQSTSSYSPKEIIGQKAELVIPIPANDCGQIALIYKGSRIVRAARTRDGSPIPGGLVHVDAILGDTAIVSKIS